jgi:tellurite resistance protein TerC
LRSLYFLLSGVVDKFHYLKLGLSACWSCRGQNGPADVFKIPIGISLAVIADTHRSIVASLLRARRLLNWKRERLNSKPGLNKYDIPQFNLSVP